MYSWNCSQSHEAMPDDRQRSTKNVRDDGTEGFGQNGLYWRLLRQVALYRRESGEKKSIKQILADEHLLLRCSFHYKIPFPEFPELREPLSTTDMSVTEFLHYYAKCEEACLRRYGIKVTPFPKEDLKEFDHGAKKAD